jgi:hypothetical protein
MQIRTAALSLLLLVPLAHAADDAVTVDRKTPTTRTRVFDPKSPPPDLKLSGKEAAITRSLFQCQVAISYVVTSKSSDGDRSRATIRVDGLKFELSLDNTLFLPKNANRKLIAHEEAHRQVAESAYESAGDTARRLATPLIGRSFSATASTPEAAASKASQAVIQKLSNDYMATAPAIADRVNDIFDDLTDHGRNRLPEADAIRQAFRQHGATTRSNAR